MCVTHDNTYSINFSLEHIVLVKVSICVSEIRHIENEEEYFDFSSLRFAWIICDRGRDRHFRSWITLTIEPIYLCEHTYSIQCAFFSFCFKKKKREVLQTTRTHLLWFSICSELRFKRAMCGWRRQWTSVALTIRILAFFGICLFDVTVLVFCWHIGLVFS